MSAGFSGHLPERMLGAWRPGGSEGDWCLCHPSRELPLSWCIIEPLNQFPPRSLSPPSFLSRGGGGGGSQKKRKGRLTREVKVTSLFFSYLHLSEGGACVGLFTVHGVKWVMTSSLKPPSSPPNDETGPWPRVCRGGKSHITGGFIEGDRSNKSGPMHTAAQRHAGGCLFDLLLPVPSTAPSLGRRGLFFKRVSYGRHSNLGKKESQFCSFAIWSRAPVAKFVVPRG